MNQSLIIKRRGTYTLEKNMSTKLYRIYNYAESMCGMEWIPVTRQFINFRNVVRAWEKLTVNK